MKIPVSSAQLNQSYVHFSLRWALYVIMQTYFLFLHIKCQKDWNQGFKIDHVNVYSSREFLSFPLPPCKLNEWQLSIEWLLVQLRPWFTSSFTTIASTPAMQASTQVTPRINHEIPTSYSPCALFQHQWLLSGIHIKNSSISISTK